MLNSTEKCDRLLTLLAQQDKLLAELRTGAEISLAEFQQSIGNADERMLQRTLFGLSELGVLRQVDESHWKIAEVLTVFPIEAIEQLLSSMATKEFWQANTDAVTCSHWSAVINRTNQLLLPRLAEHINVRARQLVRPADEFCQGVGESMRDFLQTVPFNSFAAVAYAEGEPVESSLGGNCALHSLLMSQRISREFPDTQITILRAHDKLHTALLLSQQNKRYLVDTTAAQPAIPMQIPEAGEKLLYESYTGTKFTRTPILALSHTGENKFRLSSFETRSNQFNYRHYGFTLSEQADDPESLVASRDYIRKVLLQEGVLVFRIVSATSGVIALFHSLTTGQSYLLSHAWKRKRPINTIEDSDVTWQEFLNQTGFNRARLIDFINQSVSRLDRFNL